MYYWIYFNPRSREGSDFGKIMKYLSEVDFNPRSREGSDCSSRALIYILHNFNPRSREGSDKIIDKPLPIHPISIHAPARGATKTGCTVCGKQIFQSTLPRGERQCTYQRRMDFGDFNPRSREGSDDIIRLMRRIISTFQSTLPRGERPVLLFAVKLAGNFNPRSREGSDLLRKFFHFAIENFNPRSREGSDGILSKIPCTHKYFNPRSREGSDVNQSRLGG